MRIRPWLFTWGELGLIKICGQNAASLDAVSPPARRSRDIPASCGSQDFVINTDVIVLSTPEIAGLPYVISGLVAAGGLAAALSTADGLLLAIANALSHDIYYKMLDPTNAPIVIRPASIRSPRVAALLRCVRRRSCAPAAARRASTRPAVGHPRHGGLGVLARHGRKLPGAGHGHLVEAGDDDGRDLRHDRRVRALPVLSRGQTRYFPGFGVKYSGMTSLLNPVTGPPVVPTSPRPWRCPTPWRVSRPWRTRSPTRSAGSTSTTSIAACWGCRSGFLVIYVVSLITKAPSKEMQAFVDEIRKPRGGARCWKKRPDGSQTPSSQAGPSGPRFFVRALLRYYARSGPRHRSAASDSRDAAPVRSRTYWYYHLPNFVLAALMYTLLGRAVLGLIVQPDDLQLHLARLLPPHRSGRPRRRAGHAQGGPPVVIWLFGVVWLFWLRVLLLYGFLTSGFAPKFGGRLHDGTPLVLYRHCLLRDGQRHVPSVAADVVTSSPRC